jgi:hypothetical protein
VFGGSVVLGGWNCVFGGSVLLDGWNCVCLNVVLC